MPQEKSSAPPGKVLQKEETGVPSTTITHALFIGFLTGIILFSVAKNTWGLLTIIPLYMIYRLLNRPQQDRSPSENKQQGSI